jgi:hypothetical protein
MMTCSCLAWEFTADTYLLKLQHLQHRVLLTIGNCPRHMLICEQHVAFNIPYVYDFATQLCKHQAEVIQNHKNVTIHNIGQGKKV